MQHFFSRLVFFLIALFMGIQMQAQFYDKSDQIRFYQAESGDGVWIINFDGYDGTHWWDGSSDNRDLIKRLVKNENYYEQKLFEKPYNLKYEPTHSTSSEIVYSYKLYLQYGNQKKYMKFSADGKYLYTGSKKYIRVPKETFIRKRKR